jgi:hypothetical protein
LRTLERLAGGAPLADDFALQIPQASPSAGILRAFESRLIGSTFTVFVRQFAVNEGDAAETQLHFHIAPDSRDESEAVHAAAAPLNR